MQRVAFLGLGMMGGRQAGVLRRAGFDVRGWNRTRTRADAWAAEHGGQVAGTPREAADGAEAVVTMLVDGAQAEEVLLGADGAVQALAPGALVVDMTTTSPPDARRIGAALAERGIDFLDAPVSGSLPKAQAGTLTIMAGGEPAALERARPLLDAMGETIIHAGPVGDGQAIKVLTNAVAAVTCAAVGQALVAAGRAGLDLDTLIEAMAGSAAASAMVNSKARPMRDHDFTPMFRLEHMLKDIRFALDEAHAAGAPFPLAADAAELYAAALGRGLGDGDFAGVIEAIEGLAGTSLANTRT
jgi:3-hydroxyisobutyrate dehydrogenase-like beta-hydroxyacid dehydrogenase